VLHAAQGGAPRDTPVANYRIRYADGQTADWQSLHGRDVDGYLFTEQTGLDNPAAKKVAYSGQRTLSGERVRPVRLFYGVWENPSPQKPVEAIDFQSLGADCAPFCVAMTAEGAPPDAAEPPLATAPFDAARAKAQQDAWAAHLGVPVEIENGIGLKMRLIPPGEFLMGNTEAEAEKLARALEQGGAGDFDKFVARMSSPQHRVRLTRPYRLSETEVTVGQYRRFIEATKYVPSMEQLGVKRFGWTESVIGPDEDQRAVIGVSWDDARAFCKWLSENERRKYDLPTEAQWEFACRAGTTTAWSFGDDAGQLERHAIFGRESFWPADVVGKRAANPFGLFDMHGNADEWCLDWHHRDFYATGPTDDPVCAAEPQDKNSGRVARGGTSHSAPWWTRSTTRAFDFPATPMNPKGFRVAMVGDLSDPAAAAAVTTNAVEARNAEKAAPSP
jgi:sulfatase modifying factor 1